MSAERFDEGFARLNQLSERIFGAPEEVGTAEAEELLTAAGIDPEELAGTLYQRMSERSREYSRAGRPLPPLLRQALDDLRPASLSSESETATGRTARLAIARLLEQIRELPHLLRTGPTVAFTAAYRDKAELSARDKEILDGVVEDLRRRTLSRETHER